MFLFLSLWAHATFWFLTPKPRPPPQALRSGNRIEVAVIDPHSPPATANAPLQPQRHKPKLAPRTPPKEKASDSHQDIDSPVPERAATAPTPSPSDQPSTSGASDMPSADVSAGNAGKEGQRNDPASGVKLFDPSALGASVRRWSGSQPSTESFTTPHGGESEDSPAAEKSRVEGRLSAQIGEAQAEGAVRGGLISSCNDGYDQGHDGMMDCADPGCRMLPVCKNTKEYSKEDGRDIPDNDAVGLFSDQTAEEDGDIRALSVRVRLTHGSPGDVALELENRTTGKKVTVHLADRSSPVVEKAYYVRDMLGTESAGTWRLRVRDVIRGVSGRLDDWTLFITR